MKNRKPNSTETRFVESINLSHPNNESSKPISLKEQLEQEEKRRLLWEESEKNKITPKEKVHYTQSSFFYNHE